MVVPDSFYFGVEVSVLPSQYLKSSRLPPYDFASPDSDISSSKLGISITEDDVVNYKLDYILGGAHWPIGPCPNLNALLQSFHQQNIFLLTHPLVDVLAHPWWVFPLPLPRESANPIWLEDFSVIPKSMHTEMIAAAIQYSTALEINRRTILFGIRESPRFLTQYLDFLALAKEQGVKFAFGSDSHCGDYANSFKIVWPEIEHLIQSPTDSWLPCRGNAIDKTTLNPTRE